MDTLRQSDLETYLARIGHTGPERPDPDLNVLRALHAAHMASIPFENIDILLGRPISLDLGSLHEKIVKHRRGGYCFEQNTLFAAALQGLGFQVTTLEARVRPRGASGIMPRTHMVLQVNLDGRPWLADVGFGGDGPIHPVPLFEAESEQPGGSYRVIQEANVRVLQLRRQDGWQDLYAFTLVCVFPVDFEVANYFTSTHPRSPFVRSLTAQIVTPAARHVLRNRTYSIFGRGVEMQELSDDEIVRLLREQYGLLLPEPDIRRALRGLTRLAT